MDENLLLEEQRLQPLLSYYQSINVGLNDFFQERLQPNDVVVDWDEDAFNNYDNNVDDIDDNDSKWGNVRKLKLHYSKINMTVSEQLFEGSHHSSRDLARFILSFKSNNLKIGDNIIAEIVGMFASFLPEGIK